MNFTGQIRVENTSLSAFVERTRRARNIRKGKFPSVSHECVCCLPYRPNSCKLYAAAAAAAAMSNARTHPHLHSATRNWCSHIDVLRVCPRQHDLWVHPLYQCGSDYPPFAQTNITHKKNRPDMWTELCVSFSLSYPPSPLSMPRLL